MPGRLEVRGRADVVLGQLQWPLGTHGQHSSASAEATSPSNGRAHSPTVTGVPGDVPKGSNGDAEPQQCPKQQDTQFSPGLVQSPRTSGQLSTVPRG